MELFKLFGTIALNGADEVEDDLRDVSNSAEGSEGKMSGAFKKIGKAIATYFVADKIVAFGKAAVETAAEVAAESSAFEQIMGDYSDNAQAKINEVADATGIVATRLQPHMTSLTAKFKGLGYDVDEATDLAQDGLMVAADAAAFWDKSMEDSMSALNSFVNGNYEGGEAIGLFANETTLASWAAKNLNMDWKTLDEKQKQFARLEFAKAMQKSSGATGQAAKESDQYANVVANLKENWRQFIAIIGTPILAAVTPIIKGISTALGFLGGWLKKLPEWWNNNVSSSDTFKQIMSALKSVVETLKSSWDIVFPHLQVVFGNVLSVLKTIWETVGKPIFETFKNIVMSIIDVFNFVFPIISEIFGTVVAFLSEIWETKLKVVFEAIGTKVQAVGSIFSSIFSAIGSIVKFVFEGIKLVWETVLKPAFDIIIQVVKTIGSIFSTVWNKVKSVTSTVFGFISSFLKTIWNGIKAFLTPIINAIKSIITTAWNSIKAVITTVMNAIKSVISTVWNAIKSIISGVLNTIKSIVSSVWNSIKSIISGVVNRIKSIVSSVWNGIKSTTSSVFNSIKGIASSVWNSIKNAIINPVKSATNTVKNLINKIKGFFNFKWKLPDLKLPHISIKGKFSLVPPNAPDFSIKWYAKGGIMTKPTMFGYDALTQTAHVGGEAGAEAIAPIDTLLGYVKTAVNEENRGLASSIDRLIDMLSQFLPEILSNMDKNIVLDGGALVGQLSGHIDAELGNINRLKGRGR